jgi:hypothetical protein
MAKRIFLTPDSEKMEEEYEFDNYIESFTAASDRVRHVMIISLIASILVFAAFRINIEEGWLMLRVKKARVSERNNVGAPGIEARIDECKKNGPAAASFVDPCEAVEAATAWYQRNGYGPASFQEALKGLEGVRSSEAQLVDVPFLGIEFDINDLGFFSAIGLFVLALVLCYSMSRHHENLYLCLWKIRRVAQKEGRPNDGQSKANFLYHCLVMAQVFSRPPTLARWAGYRVSRVASQCLFLAPLFVQGSIFYHDWKTLDTGLMFSSSLTAITMIVHAFFSFLLLVTSLITFQYARAADKRWKATFYEINPMHRYLKSPGLLSWLWPRFSMYRFRGSGEQLTLVNLEKMKAWDARPPLSWRCVPARVRAPSEEPLSPYQLQDGWVYELTGRHDGSVSICKQPNHHYPTSRWVRSGAVISEDPLALLFVEELVVKRVTHCGLEESLFSLPRLKMLPSRRKLDVACGKEASFLIDYNRRWLWKLPSDSSEPDLGRPDMKFRWWQPVAMAFRGDGRLLVALVPPRLPPFLGWILGTPRIWVFEDERSGKAAEIPGARVPDRP